MEKLIRRGAELGFALTAIATLILAGCGGGGGSSADSTPTTSTTVTPYKGLFTRGTVTLRDVYGNPVTLTAGGTINASGVANITFPANVAYPLTVEVNGTYLDETNNFNPIDMPSGTVLRSLLPDAAQAASGVPVTVITDIARAMLPASGFSAASAVAAITAIASNVLGVSSYADAMKPPVFDATGKTADPLTIKLTALAQEIANSGSGVQLHEKLHDIAQKLAAGSAVNAVIDQARFQNALAAFNGGASSVLPAGVSTPPTITLPSLPNAPLHTVIQNSLPTCAQGQPLQISASGLTCVASGGSGGNTSAPSGGSGTSSFGSLSVSGNDLPGTFTFSPALGSSGAQTGLYWANTSNLQSPILKYVSITSTAVSFEYREASSSTIWSAKVPTGGLSDIGVTMDLAAGTVTFNNVSLQPVWSGSTVTLNGTLKITPLTGSALTFTGTGTAQAGDGMDAPPATVTSNANIDTYEWGSAQGVIIIFQDNHNNGRKGVDVMAPGGRFGGFQDPGTALAIDTAGKKVTFTNLTLSGVSPTTTSLTINGSLTLP